MKWVIVLILSISTNAFSQSKPLFTLLSPKQTGISFSNEIKEDEAQNVLAYEYFYNGGGVAVGDINNDGLDDIFFTANLKSNTLYLNDGNFHFKDITKSAKVAGRHDWKTGCTMVDINGDGWLDIYVCYSGKGTAESRTNELYINNHDNTFTESAKEYGLDDKGCSTQAIFFDYDRDGDLDCYVVNHNIKAYKNVGLHYLKKDYDSLAADRLYRNDNGHFIDVSKSAGISGNPISFGLGVAVSDINNDGWPDIYVSNDYTEQDYLYINNKNGTFSQREMYAFGHMSQFSMGNDIADINNDGLVDIVTLDMLPEDNRRQKLLQGQENYELYQYMIENGFHYQYMRNMLQLNNGNGTFSEIGQLAGISNTDWSWAPLVADFDNDGYKDLFITNGYMRDYTNKDFLKFWGDYLVKQAVNHDSINYFDIVKMMPSTNVANYAFKNNGDLTYKNVSEDWGLKLFSLSNGAAYTDLDNDGDLDLIVNNINEPAFIFRNESEGKNYLAVQLKGSDKNLNGLGAKLFCYTGGKMQFLEQMPTRGYQSSVSDRLHFGLGDSKEIDSIRVVWPNGNFQVLQKIQANQLITVDQNNSKSPVPLTSLPAKKMFAYQKPLINYSHLQLEYNDFKRQPLMPVMLSQCSPKMAKADVNGDGLEDIFIGSSQGQSGQLFLQTKDGFIPSQQPCFSSDSNSVTTSILFFDADNDGDLDLYCASGGYNDFVEGDERLQDRLFINDGKGNFELAKGNLPPMLVSKSVVCAADFDGDGDLDLFVGGRVVPGMYPQTPESYLLQNDGTGKFTNITASRAPNLRYVGMVTDAKWFDYNKDGKPDLFVVGEWMSPTIFGNSGTQLIPAAEDSVFNKNNGWWNTIEIADLDNDGDSDIVIGNWGLNSQLKCSVNEPLTMIYKDFDNNGSVDPFLCCYIQGKQFPYVSRDELLDEIYPMRKKFTSYKSYADASMSEIFTTDELKDAKTLTTTNLGTSYFENKKGRFYLHPLPVQAQYSPVYKVLVEDFNDDGFPDLLLLGNNEYPRLKLGKMDANFGTLLLNDGKGNFVYSANKDNGLFIAGDTKDALVLRVTGNKYLLVTINGADLNTYKLGQ
ncbi:MAG: VCBS repeat-containing protein [Flavisolibacter sp.]